MSSVVIMSDTLLECAAMGRGLFPGRAEARMAESGIGVLGRGIANPLPTG